MPDPRHPNPTPPPHSPGKDERGQNDPQHDQRKPDQHQPPQQEPEPQSAAMQTQQGIVQGLVALDETIRRELRLPGPPGSGVFTLLDSLSVQLLGTHRSSFPVAASNPPGNYGRQQAPLPGVPGTSPPGPLPGAGRGQAQHANASAPTGTQSGSWAGS